MSNPNDPAYPHWYFDEEGDKVQSSGMTIRQRFVMAAMQAQIAFNCGYKAAERIAEQAIKYADAALAEEVRTRSKA